MKILIKSARIISQGSPLHSKKRDVLLETKEGSDRATIVKIAATIEDKKAVIITSKGLCISPSWVDMSARFCDPGFEFKEDFESGLAAARKGGFGYVMAIPSSLPVADNKGAIEYILSKGKESPVRILACGALSEKMQGKQLAEMFDMSEAGAVAFSDDKNHIGTELMTRALEYSNNFGGLIISFPHDNGVNAHGLVHEGRASVSLGLQGIPSIAEELRLQRDIELLKYTGGRLHVSMISTARSVELIRKAKKDKLNITCGMAAHQLSYTDDDLSGFNSNLKVLPPFRTKQDHTALVAGLKDGTIDVICSDHTPEDVEHKVREFEDANFGISSLETAFCSIWNQVSETLPIEDLITKLTANPANILKQEQRLISEGYNLGITVFSTDEYTTFSSQDWQSKSQNSPFIDQVLKGKVLMMG